MATRCRIGIQNQDNTVSSIYCHFDGYQSGVGDMLYKHYRDREKLQQLIELGDISYLGVDLDSTCAYHRGQRGEELNKARIDSSLESFANSDYEQYGYVYLREGGWIVHVDYSDEYL
jgi:hypothetical protein